MPTFHASTTKMQHVYLQTKEQMKAVNGSEPDHDQVVQAMLEDLDHLDEYERYYIADLTCRQTENLFIHKQQH